MPILYLVRHAKPAAGWGDHPDPGLDTIGVTQARITADDIAKRTAPIKLLTSPMTRCRETALALEQKWQARAEVLAAVAEIPSPPIDLAERRKWLVAAMTSSWRRLQASAPPMSPDFIAWRDGLLRAVIALREPTVIFSHYIAINAIVGAARGVDDVVCFRPDHASVTIVNTDGGRVQLIELGREAVTTVMSG